MILFRFSDCSLVSAATFHSDIQGFMLLDTGGVFLDRLPLSFNFSVLLCFMFSVELWGVRWVEGGTEHTDCLVEGWVPPGSLQSWFSDHLSFWFPSWMFWLEFACFGRLS